MGWFRDEALFEGPEAPAARQLEVMAPSDRVADRLANRAIRHPELADRFPVLHRRAGQEEVGEPRREAGRGPSDSREEVPRPGREPDGPPADVPRWHRRPRGDACHPQQLAPRYGLTRDDVTVPHTAPLITERRRTGQIVH